MIFPTLDNLPKHADNRFTLVTVAAKRARKIIEEDHGNEEQLDKEGFLLDILKG